MIKLQTRNTQTDTDNVYADERLSQDAGRQLAMPNVNGLTLHIIYYIRPIHTVAIQSQSRQCYAAAKRWSVLT